MTRRRSIVSATMIMMVLWASGGGVCCPAQEATATAFPAELTRFTADAGNPLFQGAGPGHWDAMIRERGWILWDGDHYKMWYTGYDGTREGVKMLGLATSSDGVHWKRSPRNPLYEKHWVEDMMVVRQGDRYYMFAEGRGDQAHLLISDDGLQWSRKGPLDVRLQNGEPIPAGPYGTPTAFHHDGVWNLFYERYDAGVWLARSKDMNVWTNVSDEPVLRPGPAAYDKKFIAMNQIIPHNGRFYAYYHGSGEEDQPKRLWCTCLAVSDDLTHWTKYPGNPLLPLPDNKSSGILAPSPDGRQLWLYTMHNQVRLHRPVAPTGSR